MPFSAKYERLEYAFERRVEKDRAEFGIESTFLPNLRPEGPVDFVLIAQEPSGGKGNPDKAREGTDWDNRNFSGSLEDFILHYCVKEYLCKGGKTYYLTDLSKGAMPTNVAGRGRGERYAKWYPLLQRELRLVAKSRARIIPIGKEVDNFLKQKSLDWPVEERILHYSKTAAKYRGKECKLQPEACRQFCAEIKLRDVEQAAKEVLAQVGRGEVRINCHLNRLRRGSGLTPSRKKLMFDYKVAFARINGETT